MYYNHKRKVIKTPHYVKEPEHKPCALLASEDNDAPLDGNSGRLEDSSVETSGRRSFDAVEGREEKAGNNAILPARYTCCSIQKFNNIYYTCSTSSRHESNRLVNPPCYLKEVFIAKKRKHRFVTSKQFMPSGPPMLFVDEPFIQNLNGVLFRLIIFTLHQNLRDPEERKLLKYIMIYHWALSL